MDNIDQNHKILSIDMGSMEYWPPLVGMADIFKNSFGRLLGRLVEPLFVVQLVVQLVGYHI